VGRITPAGTITLFKQFGDGESGDRANGITVGPDGNLWFIATGGIGRSTPGGVITLFEIPGIAHAITRGPDGNLWFGMFTAGEIRIGRISPAGATAYYPPDHARIGRGDHRRAGWEPVVHSGGRERARSHRSDHAVWYHHSLHLSWPFTPSDARTWHSMGESARKSHRMS
jgi:streptogramin lyase